ncbi:MAG TPA: ABC transporter substrate-binding protein [Gaiellales bacterium]
MRRLRLLAVLIPLLLATGCGFKPEPIGSLPSFPQTVVDGLGRHVTVTAQPHRVVSLDPGLTETAFAIGAGSAVVAASGREQYPPAAQRLPRAVAAGAAPSDARLRTLRPDLVLAPASTTAAAAAALGKAVGAPVYVASTGNLPGIEHDVDQVAALTGRADAGHRVVRGMQAALHDVDTALAGTAPVPVFVDEGFFYTIEPTSTAAKLLQLAGGQNVAGSATPGRPFPLASLRAAAPQVYLAIQGRGVTLAGLRRTKATRTLPAVRERHFALVDAATLADTGPRAAAEVVRLARMLHPSLHIP